MTDMEVVESYLLRLEAVVGNDREFLPLFKSLSDDTKVGQAEAVAIASRFMTITPPSTSRAKALERVLKRHTALAMFKLKQRAMQGRSAA